MTSGASAAGPEAAWDAAASLVPDCSACAALCCVALAFDKGERFGFDKPAGTPCPNLSRHLCSIHERLEHEGFSGCAAYGCGGAGQRVVQELFAGTSWRDDPALLAPMIDAFAGMRAVQARVELLVAAARLPLLEAEEAARRHALAALAPGALPGVDGFGVSDLAREIDGFIRSLRHHAEGK
ncbi:hypothetical protein ACQ5SO_13780 [Rhodovulum sp. DZ06]|uniref:hypothetical protein n=1 Tax=Rhodovulum sp. DZ06 TaxID=3425126 RepID=UPI003D33277D